MNPFGEVGETVVSSIDGSKKKIRAFENASAVFDKVSGTGKLDSVQNLGFSGGAEKDKLEDKRDELLKKERGIKENLGYHTKNYDTLLKNKSDGMVGVDTAISNHKFGIQQSLKEYKQNNKELRDIENQIKKEGK